MNLKPVACLAILVLALAAPGAAAAGDDGISSLLVGSWRCDSGACWEEEIQFAIEDGERHYYSWLHERPAAVDGAWSVDGNIVSIRCCDGLDYSYVVVRVTAAELLLRDADSGEETLLRRIVASDAESDPPAAPAP